MISDGTADSCCFDKLRPCTNNGDYFHDLLFASKIQQNYNLTFYHPILPGVFGCFNLSQIFESAE
jgi:hypothetical protein